jgi:hypothetical protein
MSMSIFLNTSKESSNLEIIVSILMFFFRNNIDTTLYLLTPIQTLLKLVNILS